jgi:hypothetical protein
MLRAPADPGFEMHDLLDSPEFTRRQLDRRSTSREQAALSQILQRLSTGSLEAALQELVECAVEYCGADSAGVSLEEPDGKGGGQFRWIATAGSFRKYLNGTTPRNFSPCGVCIDENRPQWYKVTKPYYDFLGVVADPITDGMLVPWKSDTKSGTIWAVSHKPEPVFQMDDYLMLRRLADLISIASNRPFTK